MRAWLALTLAALGALGCASPAPASLAGENGGGNRGSSGAHRGGSTGATAAGSGTGGSTSRGGSSGGGSSGGGSGSATPADAGPGSAASTGGSGSTGGGSSSGAVACSPLLGYQGSGVFDCKAPPSFDAGPPGCSGPAFATTVQDLETCGAVCGATVTLLDQSGVPIPGASQLSGAESGTVAFCLPGDVAFTPTATAPGYPLFYYGEIQGQLADPLLALGMLSNDSVSTISGLLTGYAPGSATLVATTATFGGVCGRSEGWSVSLALPDGGAWPDGGYTAYYCEAGTGLPVSTLTATSTYGVALLVGIDPSVAEVAQLVFENPDAGACPSVNQAAGFTGRIRLGIGAISIEPIFLP